MAIVILFVFLGTNELNISIVTTTSVGLSWTQPATSRSIQYMVSLTPNSSQSCADTRTINSAPIASTTADVMTMTFTGLEESSSYTATIAVRQGGVLLEALTLGGTQFTTLSSGRYDTFKQWRNLNSVCDNIMSPYAFCNILLKI